VETGDLISEIQALQQRMEELQRQAGQSPVPLEAVTQEVFEELQTTLEELQVAQEELQQQNEELAHAREAAEAERQRYQELFDFAPDGYLVTDTEGTIREANRAAATLLNVSPKFLQGKPLTPFFAKEERSTFYRQLDQLQKNLQKVQDWQTIMRPRGGAPFPAALDIAVLRNPRGEMVGLLWLLRDITARKQAEDRLHASNAELERRVQGRTAALQQSNENLQQFAYVASHDLQEPLRMVSSFMQLLAQRYQGKLDADADEFIGYALEGAQRMQTLIEDLLVYARVDGDRQEQAFAETDCETILERTLRVLQKAIRESGIAVTHEPLPTVRGDAVQLGQVLQNLLSNAIKFRSAEPPRVHISARQEETHWLFSVRDNGIGLDPQHAERIFVIFQRLHPRGAYPGTGVGLAICKKIVERHSGRIWVESRPGEGATFCFTLPIRQ